MSDYQSPPDIEPKSGSGAKVATGCGIGCLAMVLISGILVFLGIRAIQSKVDELAERATADPIQFEYPEVQAFEAESAVKRFDDFGDAIKNSRPAEPLVLSEDDINILISQHKDLKALSGRFMVDIVDDQIGGDFSIKPEELPFKIPFLSKALEGKYINGKAQVDLRVKDGEAEMYLIDFKFAEMSLPEEFKTGFKNENLLQDSNNDKAFRDLIGKIEELKIEDNKLHIVPKKVAEPTPVPVP